MAVQTNKPHRPVRYWYASRCDDVRRTRHHGAELGPDHPSASRAHRADVQPSSPPAADGRHHGRDVMNGPDTHICDMFIAVAWNCRPTDEALIFCCRGLAVRAHDRHLPYETRSTCGRPTLLRKPHICTSAARRTSAYPKPANRSPCRRHLDCDLLLSSARCTLQPQVDRRLVADQRARRATRRGTRGRRWRSAVRARGLDAFASDLLSTRSSSSVSRMKSTVSVAAAKSGVRVGGLPSRPTVVSLGVRAVWLYCHSAATTERVLGATRLRGLRGLPVDDALARPHGTAGALGCPASVPGPREQIHDVDARVLPAVQAGQHQCGAVGVPRRAIRRLARRVSGQQRPVPVPSAAISRGIG